MLLCYMNLHWIIIKGSCEPCDCFPRIEEPKYLVCQGFHIQMFPPYLTQYEKTFLQEIYLTETYITCIPPISSGEYLSLIRFGESHNALLNCSCLTTWWEHIDENEFTSDCTFTSVTDIISSSPHMIYQTTSSQKHDGITEIISTVYISSSDIAEATSASEIDDQTNNYTTSDSTTTNTPTISPPVMKRWSYTTIIILVISSIILGGMLIRLALGGFKLRQTTAIDDIQMQPIRSANYRGMPENGVWEISRSDTTTTELHNPTGGELSVTDTQMELQPIRDDETNGGEHVLWDISCARTDAAHGKV